MKNHTIIVHMHKVFPEHDWVKDENGEIDLWAWDYEFHAGPRCKRCGQTPCVYCDPNWKEADDPCVVDKYVCANCNYEFNYDQRQEFKYCPECGLQIKKWRKKNEKN